MWSAKSSAGFKVPEFSDLRFPVWANSHVVTVNEGPQFTVMDGLEGSITDSLRLLSGNLIIQEKGAIDQVLSIVNASLVDALENNENILAVSPEIYVARNLKRARGVTDSYREIVSPGYIKIGSYFNETDSRKILLGSKLAERLGLEVRESFPVDSINFTVVRHF